MEPPGFKASLPGPALALERKKAGPEILMSGNEDTPELAPESIGLQMVWLKTVIDALDR